MRAYIWRGLPRPKLPIRGVCNARSIIVDTRNRLSSIWAPTGSIGPEDDSHTLLIKGGFLRPTTSGIFHLLPLGLRVQDKLSLLIDKHMHSLGASKLSLSSITSEDLWRQSGRYSTNSELLRLKDRKDSGLLLTPTHEEEITAIVAGMVKSYRDLPVRLYQTGRKYRDERRPRQGLLRAKEFVMKDLYTFDHTHEAALETYQAVRTAYNKLFDELKIPYLVADADSGNMGGNLSHEYHFVSPKGEDHVWSCSSCNYIANEELVEKRSSSTITQSKSASPPLTFTAISIDRTTSIHLHIPRPSTTDPSLTPTWSEVHSYANLHAIKNTGIDIDTGIESSTLETLLPKTTSEVRIYDRAVSPTPDDSLPDLTRIQPGDSCPRCESGQLDVEKAIEVGHTFHLGTRYSEPLNALIAVPDSTKKQPIQMGCHGIGVSRIIGAVASILSDSKGLNWPRCIAPFEVVVLTGPTASDADAREVYDMLAQGRGTSKVDAESIDTVLDDRVDKSLGWKLRDADLIGYPIIVVLGRAWKEKREMEVQCRRLGIMKTVALKSLRECVVGLLNDL